MACRGGSEGVSVSNGMGNGVWCGSPEVGASETPVNIELALAGAIPDPVEAHVNRL